MRSLDSTKTSPSPLIEPLSSFALLLSSGTSSGGFHGDVTEVRVYLDGALVATQLDGKAIELDPGGHVLRFEHGGLPSVEERVLVVVKADPQLTSEHRTEMVRGLAAGGVRVGLVFNFSVAELFFARIV